MKKSNSAPAPMTLASMTPIQFRQAIAALFGGYGSQRKFARLTGIHETSVRRYMTGTRPIPQVMVLLLTYMHERLQAGLDLRVDAAPFIESLPSGEPQEPAGPPTFADLYE
ncbi:hypothetical protein [Iodidimonas sp. SYSU 1G8]|uniref:hypothetical protein n=1 Tax=Iodidimonas sp. SYSU 1G8 TaxID=3133967 RepID=UPI0031FE9E52